MAASASRTTTTKSASIPWPFIAGVVAVLVVILAIVIWRISSTPSAPVAKATSDSQWLQAKAIEAHGNVNNLSPEDRARVVKTIGPMAEFSFMQLSKAKKTQ